MSKKMRKVVLSYAVVLLLLVEMFLVSAQMGSLKLTLPQLFRGLFVQYDPNVATVYDLRFPRILIAMLAGAAVAVSGVLLQAVLKNPLADPGIIGVSSGAGLMTVCVSVFLPSCFFLTPLFACAGGMAAFLLVYVLSWKGGLSPLRIILTGVAMDAFFSSAAKAVNALTGGERQGVASVVEGNITQKTWEDVRLLIPYVAVGLILAFLSRKSCNLLQLEDKTAKGLGINVNRSRICISFIAVILASISTAVAGSISFLGLIVPHMGRLLVGSDHKKLIPFSAILGAFIFLAADTVGRTIAMPYEVKASIIMSIFGGPFFIILLRKSKKN